MAPIGATATGPPATSASLIEEGTDSNVFTGLLATIYAVVMTSALVLTMARHHREAVVLNVVAAVCAAATTVTLLHQENWGFLFLSVVGLGVAVSAAWATHSRQAPIGASRRE